jgi:hypothetical protein
MTIMKETGQKPEVRSLFFSPIANEIGRTSLEKKTTKLHFCNYNRIEEGRLLI